MDTQYNKIIMTVGREAGHLSVYGCTDRISDENMFLSCCVVADRIARMNPEVANDYAKLRMIAERELVYELGVKIPESATCPICGGVLDEEELTNEFGTAGCGEIEEEYLGRCQKCNNRFTWRSRYTSVFLGSDSIKEAKEDS